jgi:phosphatidylserine decarboxylase
MSIARGGWSWILGSLGIPAAVAAVCGFAGATGWVWVFVAVALVAGGFMLFFFRDPDRRAPGEGHLLIAGADGVVRTVEDMPESSYLKCDTVRISVFLSPFDVHVNRSPLAGKVAALAYTPGKHFLTMRDESSEYNEHSSIYIEGSGTRCLVKQIVGPVVRRVVYWLEDGQEVAKGERIGIMKFGSRMDIYFPRSDVEVLVKQGDRVRAGETPIASLKEALST